jgi:sigma-B regulation protein RsbU (phosphoserine phosphatase)
VSGKGVSAALMMANLQALAHRGLLPLVETNSRPSSAAFVAALIRDLRGRFGNNRYVTMFYGEYDCHSKVLRYVNAGHSPVGLFPQITYEDLRVTLSSGCAIVVYTDGVTDALNSRGEEFGEERLITCCTSLSRGVDAEAIRTLLCSEVSKWSAGVEKFDDTTVLALSVD